MNLLQVPSSVIGLMGARPRQQNPMLGLVQPQMADEFDQAMFAANPNGYGIEQPQMADAIDQAMFAANPYGMNTGWSQAPQAQLQAPAQRQRASALNVLGRAFAPNITGALDTERARLQAEADRPNQLAIAQENERIARALGPQALLAFRTSPDKLGESLGYQYRPQVVAEGGLQSIAGSNQQIRNPRTVQFGDQLVTVGPDGAQTVATRGQTFAEKNDAERNRINAIGAGQNTVGRYRIDADGNPIFEAPQEYTLGQGQTRYENGQEVASAPSAAADPAKAEMRRQSALTTIGNTRSAVEQAMGQVNRLSTGALSGLIPGNQWKANLEATADTISANLSFAELQKMREASPTGGALGGIAVRELDLLGSAVASLKTSQSPEQFERNLERVMTHLNNWEQTLMATGSSPSVAPPAGFVLD